MKTPQQIRQERAQVLGQAQQVRDEIRAAEGEPPADLVQRFEGHMARAAALEAEALRAESFDRLDRLVADLGRVDGRRCDPMPHTDPSNGDHRYSLTKAIRELAYRRGVTGLELETSREIARRSGLNPGGFFVPFDLTPEGRPASGAERRDLDATSGAGAVRADTAGTLIDALTNAMFTRRLGATVMGGLSGNFRLPKQAAIAAASWKGAAAALDESNPTIGFVPFGPKRVGTFIDYDKDLVHQSSLAVDRIVFDDLVRSIALKLDQTGIAGSGSGAEPLGIVNDTDVPVVALGTDGAAPTWDMAVRLEGRVDTGNALEGQLAYLTTPRAKSALKTTKKDAGSGLFIWDDITNQINGYGAFATNQVPANLSKGTGSNLSALIFGNWASLYFALWGGLDVLANPYSQDINDLVRVSARQYADVQLRHAASFAVCKDMIAQ